MLTPSAHGVKLWPSTCRNLPLLFFKMRKRNLTANAGETDVTEDLEILVERELLSESERLSM